MPRSDSRPIDGVPGSNLQRVIQDFQRGNGYPVTGGISDELEKQISAVKLAKLIRKPLRPKPKHRSLYEIDTGSR